MTEMEEKDVTSSNTGAIGNIGVCLQEHVLHEHVPVPPSFHLVEIKKVANGFIIKVGCKTFVEKTWDDVSKGLAEYWVDPSGAEKKYTK